MAFIPRAGLAVLAWCYSLAPHVFFNPDTDFYLSPARELLAHGRFYSNGAPEIIRTPGYPLLLGLGLGFGHFVFITIACQVVLSCFTVYIVYRLSQTLFDSDRVGIVAALLYAFEPLSLVYVSQLTTETLFTALTTLSLYFLVRYLKRPWASSVMLAGLALAASIYVRPIAYFLPFAIAVLLIWRAQQQRPARRRRLFVHVAIFLLVSVIPLAAWQVRNYVETGYRGFSGISSVNSYFYLAASVLAVERGAPFFKVQRDLGYLNDNQYLTEHPEQKLWTTAQRLDYMKREARQILLARPFLYLKIHVAGIFRAVMDPGAVTYLELFGLYEPGGGLFGNVLDKGIWPTLYVLLIRRPLVFWINLLLLQLLAVYLAGALVACVFSNAFSKPGFPAVLLFVIYLLFISGGPAALGRFRQPAMPMISTIASYALYVAATKWKTASSKLVRARTNEPLAQASQ